VDQRALAGASVRRADLGEQIDGGLFRALRRAGGSVTVIILCEVMPGWVTNSMNHRFDLAAEVQQCASKEPGPAPLRLCLLRPHCLRVVGLCHGLL